MRIISMDQSTVMTAWALFDDDKLVEHGAFDHKRDKKDAPARCSEMGAEIQQLIDAKHPDLVVFEDVSLQSNAMALIHLARLQGRIMQICEETGCAYRFYKPSAWRKEMGIKQGRVKREELKRQAIELVKSHYDIDDLTDDIAEAICIGLCDIQKSKELKGN